MKTKLTLLLYLFPFILLSQSHPDLDTLIKEMNHYLSEYEKLHVSNDRNYLSISGFGLSPQEVEELIEEANYDSMLTKNKDSIQAYHMIYYFQDKIKSQLNLLIEHPDFQENEIKKLITNSEFDILSSDDDKLFIFHLDPKYGGHYRSRISRAHYTNFKHENEAQSIDSYSVFNYYNYISNIDALQTEEGTKYVMIGYATHYGPPYTKTFVSVITSKEDRFVEEFYYSVNSIDWDDGVYYDYQTKTINVNYQTNDLTPYCTCREGRRDKGWTDYDNYYLFRCKCKFAFNGLNFELIEDSCVKMLHPSANYTELLSFKIAENQKEVKIISDNNSKTLYYILLKPDGIVEFSYPNEVNYYSDMSLSDDKSRLTFTIGKIKYQIYENKEQNKSAKAGVVVTNEDKKYDLKGDPNTIKGTLQNIDTEQFKNTY